MMTHLLANVNGINTPITYWEIDMRMKEIMMIVEAMDEYPLDVPTMSEEDLAEKYKVDISVVERARDKGIEEELEHTTDREVAREIALDHLGERLDWYDRYEECMAEDE